MQQQRRTNLSNIQCYMLTENMMESSLRAGVQVPVEKKDDNVFMFPKQKSAPVHKKVENMQLQVQLQEPEKIVEVIKEVIVKEVVKEVIVKEVVPIQTPIIKKPVSSPFFIPKQKDSLFWCFYIIKNGFSKYEFPNTTSFENEKMEKFNCIEVLRTKKQMLKTKKIKNIREHVEDDLGNKDKISMKTFIALCIGENINILFIHKRKCFDLECVEGEPYHVVHCLEHGKYTQYGYETEATTQKEWDHYKNHYFHWESLEKPLKAVSSYTLDELWTMYKQLIGEETPTVKKSKKELYEYIMMNI